MPDAARPPRSAGIVLAGGSSRRMGRTKQLLDVGGVPMLEHVVAQACASSLADVVVVLGADADAIRAGVALGRAREVVNGRHAEGMSTSLRAGLDALDGEVERAVVLLADQPDVDAALIEALLELHSRSGREAAALSVDGVLQPPAVISRTLWPAVESLLGDVGLRGVLRDSASDVATLTVDRVRDVDTPEDYDGLLTHRARR